MRRGVTLVVSLASAIMAFQVPQATRTSLTKTRMLPEVALSVGLLTAQPNTFPSHLISKTEVREGIYGSYEVTVPDRVDTRDDAKSTFKTRAETKKNRNKYVGVFAVLLVGSFIIPMLQYFWYVRDEPGSLFGPKNAPPPPPPPPKKNNFWER